MQNKFYYFLSTKQSNSTLSTNDVGILQTTNNNQDYLEILFLRINKVEKCYSNEVSYFKIEETGDRFPKKLCDRCYKLLNTEEDFQNNRIKKDNIVTKRPSCKSCRKDKDGVNIPTEIRKKWDQNRPSNFDLFSCPICNKRSVAGISKIVLDHNHSNGHVRGWLCESCNTGIGRFDDDPQLVQRAIDWLKNQNN